MTNFLFCFRTDIANPLIGDIIEYERFVHIHTQRTITKPIDHEWTVSNKVGNQSKLEQNKNRETPKKQTQPQNNWIIRIKSQIR